MEVLRGAGGWLVLLWVFILLLVLVLICHVCCVSCFSSGYPKFPECIVFFVFFGIFGFFVKPWDFDLFNLSCWVPIVSRFRIFAGYYRSGVIMGFLLVGS